MLPIQLADVMRVGLLTGVTVATVRINEVPPGRNALNAADDIVNIGVTVPELSFLGLGQRSIVHSLLLSAHEQALRTVQIGRERNVSDPDLNFHLPYGAMILQGFERIVNKAGQNSHTTDPEQYANTNYAKLNAIIAGLLGGTVQPTQEQRPLPKNQTWQLLPVLQLPGADPEEILEAFRDYLVDLY